MRSLRRTLTYQITAFIVCLLGVTTAAVWGIRGLNQDLSLATRGYERLRDVYEITAHVATARTLLSLDHPELPRALGELRSAETKLQLQRSESPATGGGTTPDLIAMADRIRDARRAVELAIAQQTVDVDFRPFQQALGTAATTAAQIRITIVQAQRSAETKRRVTTTTVSIVSALLIVGAVVIGLWQYRSVMRPLTQLGEGVRRVAGGQFEPQLRLHAHREFAALSDDFNHMAAQLDQLYHHLEQQVREKSRELVRSQRLASVGFLAAGVAHEINNPLGIITGFAEFTLQQLRDSTRTPGDEQIEKALKTICDEAYRCKQITEKLLSMARSTEAPRAAVDLSAVAREVISNLAGLMPEKVRHVHLTADSPAIVHANEAEMKQVVLNLLTNALDAIDATGRVDATVRRVGQSIELIIQDTGRGMTAATVQSVFEPFFTLPHHGRRGTGLGLSISHAIIESHNGTIHALSDGLGQGSTFRVTLPAVE